MQYQEYGDQNLPAVLLLHGGGLSWWNYREAAALLESGFHVILPVLDGHAGSDRHFTSIESNAQEIIAFIRTRLHGSVFLIGGLSLGGQILLEMLSQQGDICRHAFIESAMAVPSGLTHALIGPAFGCSYPLIRQKWFAKLQYKQLRMKAALFEDYYRDTCRIAKEDLIAFLKANTAYRIKEQVKACTADVRIYYGQRETAGIRKSARVIREMLPASSLIELPGMYHGDFSVNHAADYARAVRSLKEPETR